MSIKEVYDWYAKEGYLTAVPNGHLTLYKYAPKTVFECNWNYHTMSARGLVLDQSGNTIARPWKKFFNLNERPDTNITELIKLNDVPELAQKYDGSLIIVFFDPYKAFWRAITMGAWESPQAKWANEWLQDIGNDQWLYHADINKTYMFELVAPWNRIVVNYPEAKMIYLGWVDNISGEDQPYEDARKYAIAKSLEPLEYFKAPLDSINLEDPIVNREGYVARYPGGFRVKLKYAQYFQLHRIMTGLSSKSIWEAMSEGSNPINSIVSVPDEFKDWFNAEVTALHDAYAHVETNAKAVWACRPRGATRKELAVYFIESSKAYAPHQLTGILFNMLDDKDYSKLIWKQIKPTGHKVFSEQVKHE